MRRSPFALFFALLLVIGCHKASEPANACGADEELVDGTCKPRDCGERSIVTAGGCTPVGVPDDGCAEGFAPDGEGGCNAILPAEACAPGTYALPGETICHSIPCDEPTGVSLYVDRKAAPGGDGTAAKPFDSLAAALGAASDGSVIAVAGGTYSEQLSVTKAVKIYGRCDAPVIVKGTDSSRATFQVTAAAELHQLQITSAYAGVIAGDAKGILLDRLHVHDCRHNGLYLLDEGPGADVTVRDTFVEKTLGTAIIVSSASAKLERVVVRDAKVIGSALADSGWLLQLRHQNDATGAPAKQGATVEVKRSIFEQGQTSGIVSQSSTLRLEGVLLRNVTPDAKGDVGWGISTGTHKESPLVSSLEVIGSRIESTFGFGILVAGGSATIERTTIRDVRATVQDGRRGVGIYATVDESTKSFSTVSIDRSVVRDTKGGGITVDGSNVTIKGSIVRGIAADDAGLFGDGILAEDVTVFGTWLTSTVSVEDTLVSTAARGGVTVFGTTLTAKNLTVRCAAVPIDAEALAPGTAGPIARPANLDDQGGNQCGCGASFDTCHAESGALAPTSIDVK
ncbi:MAG: right-handed parallel beta-helix repeat-containing protein [Polyangiales bacterium]